MNFPGKKSLFWCSAWAVAAAAAVYFLPISCRSHVPVIVNAQHYQCEIRHESGNGSVEFRDCIKTDGTGPVQDNDSDSSGDDNKTGAVLVPFDGRLN